MTGLLRYWDAFLVMVIMFVCMAILALGCGALVYWLAASFSPAALACGTAAVVFLFLLFMFFRILRD